MGNASSGDKNQAGKQATPNSGSLQRPPKGKSLFSSGSTGAEPPTGAAPATDDKTALQKLVKEEVQEKLIAAFGEELIKLTTKEAVTTFLKVKNEKQLAKVGGAPAPGSAAPVPAAPVTATTPVPATTPDPAAPVPATTPDPAAPDPAAPTPAGPSPATMFADFPKKVEDFINDEKYSVPKNIAVLLKTPQKEAAQIINLLCIEVAESIIEDKPAKTKEGADPSVTGKGAAPSGADPSGADPSVAAPASGAGPSGAGASVADPSGAGPSVAGPGASGAGASVAGPSVAGPGTGVADKGAIKGGGRSRRRKCAHVCQQCTLLRKKSITRKTMTRKPMTRKKPIHTQEANNT